jgi:hypothetical protein
MPKSGDFGYGEFLLVPRLPPGNELKLDGNLGMLSFEAAFLFHAVILRNV